MVAISVAAPGAAQGLAAPGSRHRRHCDLGPEGVAFVFRQIVVYERSTSETRKSFAVCWRTSGTERGVFSAPLTSAPPPYLSVAKASRGWLFLEEATPTGGAGLSTTVGLTFNAQTGRRGPLVRSASTPLVGPLPDTNGMRQLISPVAITADGSFAWVMNGFPLRGGGPGSALYAPDGHGGDRALDQGPTGSLTKLSVTGDTVRWLDDGVAYTAKL
jgi:hypothetical protein